MEASNEDFNFVDVEEGDEKAGAEVGIVLRSIEEEKREKKRRRTTKPIEVLDMAGNVILSFNSGLECSAAINVTTGWLPFFISCLIYSQIFLLIYHR